MLQTAIMKFVVLALALLLAVGEKILSAFATSFLTSYFFPTYFLPYSMRVSPFSTFSHFLGSQAASLMADAPTELDHFRSALNMYLDRVKERAHNALATLDDPEYKELK